MSDPTEEEMAEAFADDGAGEDPFMDMTEEDVRDGADPA